MMEGRGIWREEDGFGKNFKNNNYGTIRCNGMIPSTIREELDPKHIV